MTAAILNLLDMGGGEAPADWDANAIYVPYEPRIWYIYRGIFEEMTLYLDTENKKKAQIDWSSWLGDDVDINA